MKNVKLFLPFIAFLIMSSNAHATECYKCTSDLRKDRAHLEYLLHTLKSLGVHVNDGRDSNTLSSPLEQHAVLEAKILHFQKKLNVALREHLCSRQ